MVKIVAEHGREGKSKHNYKPERRKILVMQIGDIIIYIVLFLIAFMIARIIIKIMRGY
jgi:hypothetical protein